MARPMVNRVVGRLSISDGLSGLFRSCEAELQEASSWWMEYYALCAATGYFGNSHHHQLTLESFMPAFCMRDICRSVVMVSRSY